MGCALLHFHQTFHHRPNLRAAHASKGGRNREAEFAGYRSRFAVTDTNAFGRGSGARSNMTPITPNRCDGGGNFSLKIAQPAAEVKQNHALRPDAINGEGSTQITSSTHCLTGTANNDARATDRRVSAAGSLLTQAPL